MNSSTSVTVYSKAQCVQCDMTKRRLKSLNIPFVEKDVLSDSNALSYVKGLGYLAAPVVVVTDASEGSERVFHWSGFRPERLDALNIV